MTSLGGDHKCSRKSAGSLIKIPIGPRGRDSKDREGCPVGPVASRSREFLPRREPEGKAKSKTQETESSSSNTCSNPITRPHRPASQDLSSGGVTERGMLSHKNETLPSDA